MISTFATEINYMVDFYNISKINQSWCLLFGNGDSKKGDSADPCINIDWFRQYFLHRNKKNSLK